MRLINYNEADGKKQLKDVFDRDRLNQGDASLTVTEVTENVKNWGDAAVFEYTLKFDGVFIDKNNIRVTPDEIEEARAITGEKLIAALKRSAGRITDFHSRQKRSSQFDAYPGGEIMGFMITPVETAGIYVPGGRAAYPSSVLMNVIPARVAGVKNIIMCTPPMKDGKVSPNILAAADIAGVNSIFKVGGAQAIAAMAYGTQSIPRADKITGPGNIYVALAKRAVYGYAGIDSIAGPSEILIIADDTADYKFVAADILSQAEHDELAACILITTSKALAENVISEVSLLLEKTDRRAIAEVSLNNNGAAVLVDSVETAFEISNSIAPEHLQICAKDAFSMLPRVRNAGAVFLGNFTPEALGDYIAGPNHILPTGGTARFFSPLNVDDFTKKTSVMHFSKEAFLNLASDCVTLAESEGLYAHAGAVKVRL